MKVELTDHSAVKKSLFIEVPAEEVGQEMQRVLRGYAEKARIPGFRQGKAPLSVVRTHFAKEVEDELRERIVSRSYHEAAQEKGLAPLGNPTLDELNFEDGKPLTFKTTFEVLPQFEIQSYKELEVARASDRVGEDEIDAALEELRQSRVQLHTEEGRASEDGDILLADVEGEPNEGEGFKRERMMVEVGAKDHLDAFNEKLRDAKAETDLDFSVEYPEDFPAEKMAGKIVHYKIHVHEVKVRQVPELDDEFAKDLGEFGSLDELREKVTEDLQTRKKRENDRNMQQALLDKLLVENPIVLPEVLVEEEVRHRLEDMVRHLMQQGIDPQQADLDWKALREQQMEAAGKSVHARLLLDALAEVEKLEVDNKELDERMRHDAQAMGQKYEEFKAKVKEHGNMEALRSQVLREKSLDLLEAVANIRNEE